MPKFSEVEWEPGTIFATLKEHGFFAYSGADGDLFRKNGLAGWRVSVSGRHSVRIQRRGPTGAWGTRRSWNVEWDDDLPDEDIREFSDILSELVAVGTIEVR